jgi:cyclic-di-AMP phosphodiesterase PgpH
MSHRDKIKKIFHQPEKFNFNTDIYIKLAIAVVTVFVLILFLPKYENIDISNEIGTIWSYEDVIAPFSFPIYKDDDEYKKEKEDAAKTVAPVFYEYKLSNLNDSLNNSFKALEDVFQKAGEIEKAKEGGINSEKLNPSKEKIPVDLADEQWQKLYTFYKGELKDNTTYANLKSYLKTLITGINSKSIINTEKTKIITTNISVKRDNQKMMDTEPVSQVLDKMDIYNTLKEKINNQLQDENLKNVVLILSESLIRENLFYDKSLTDLEKQNKIDQIPKTIGIVKENERIISKHDPITRNAKLKLDSYKKVRLEKIGVRDYFLQYLGKVLIVLVLLTLLSLFLFYIRRWVFKENSKLILIASIIILLNFFAYISMQLAVNYPVELLIFVPVASILLTILFDSRLAFYTTVIICMLVSAIRGGDFTTLFITLSGSGLAIFGVREIKNRTLIFRSFFFILVGYFISIVAIGLDRNESVSKVITSLIFVGVNSVMSPIIAYGLLLFYERVFKITTNLTLIELADFNHPLLKELSTKAPGTFHHSIVMGNLSEAAAEAIGANRILARIGCYYHDIGKTLRPEFYIENQIERINRHETLNPNMSAKIIIAHVKDGIELAQKYKLPKEVIDFIPMHHGSTLVSYFYNKAKNEADETKEYVLDSTYQYPGPKPQTKETAIVMLADTIEASARVVDDSSPKKLEDKIDEIIKKKFDEGQLDECDLTIKDLTLIKKSFLNILVGIHHQRIKYPEEKK